MFCHCCCFPRLVVRGILDSGFSHSNQNSSLSVSRPEFCLESRYIMYLGLAGFTSHQSFNTICKIDKSLGASHTQKQMKISHLIPCVILIKVRGNQFTRAQLSINALFKGLKHKDSFGKSENLSKIFFTEFLVFDHDYEGKSSSSNGLL